MAAEAGLKPFETETLAPREVWIYINGYERRVRTDWEGTRAICFNVAKFGNSDPKRFPKSPERFWPFPWDKGVKKKSNILEQHARMRAIREQLEKKKNGG